MNLVALQRYGMCVADNGSLWFLSGVPDQRWNDDDLRMLRQVVGRNLEFVDKSLLVVDPDSREVAPGFAVRVS